MDDLILREIEKSIKNNESVALIMLTESSGSTPRKLGSIMAVWLDRIFGTIGGGAVEFAIINEARECIKNNENRSFKYGLTESHKLKMACGGEVSGFIKVFNPRPKLVIVGAGHVGKALYKISKNLEFDISLLDDREEVKEEGIDLILGDISTNLKYINIEKNSYIVIATRSHNMDLITLRAVTNSNAKYIGMIGSRKKVKGIKETLIKEGADEESFEKLYAPIGLNISNGTPEEIAIEILGEILLIKNGGSLNHRRDIIKKKLEI